MEHGVNEEQTDKLVHGQALKFRGYLQADKRSPRVWAESVTAHMLRWQRTSCNSRLNTLPLHNGFNNSWNVIRKNSVLKSKRCQIIPNITSNHLETASISAASLTFSCFLPQIPRKSLSLHRVSHEAQLLICSTFPLRTCTSNRRRTSEPTIEGETP